MARSVGIVLAALVALPARAQLVGTVTAHLPVPLPAPLASPIQLAQVFDSGVSPCSAMSGKVGFVWADNLPCGAAVPNVTLARYFLAWREQFYSPYSTAWYQANEPQCIEYKNDRTTIAYGFSDSRYTPIAITEPACEDLIVAHVVARITPGQSVVTADNAGLINGDGFMAGHYPAATANCTPGVSCGAWKQDFSGTSAHDPAFVSAIMNHINYLRQKFEAQGYPLVMNAVAIGVAPQFVVAEGILHDSLADGVLQEGWPQDAGGTSTGIVAGKPVDGQWVVEYRVAVAASAKMFYADSYIAETTLGGMTPDEEAWSTANYLLGTANFSTSYLSLCGSTDCANLLAYPASLQPAIGTPTEPPPAANASAVNLRHFTGGIAAVNPDSVSAHSFTVPAGAHTDQFGANVASGSYSLPAATAIVVLGAPS